jgi:hypothetical protein
MSDLPLNEIVRPSLRLEPVRVAACEGDEVGRLVFLADRLVAVLVQLSGLHDELAGRWFAEALFGQLQTAAACHPTFATLDEAVAWISERTA